MYLYRSKTTLDSLKSVSMYLGENRRWVPLENHPIVVTSSSVLCWMGKVGVTHAKHVEG